MTNKAAVNLLVQVFLRTKAFILEGKYIAVSYENVYLTLQEEAD